MANVNLKAYKISKIDFNNNVNGKVQLKLSNKVSHNVRYSKGGGCEAFLTVEVFDKDNKDALNIRITVVGAFEVNSQVEKEFIHVETFKELFPFAKALVTTISASAGVPPIYVQNVDIEKQEIYRFDMNASKGE